MKKIIRPISAALLIGSAGLYAQNAPVSHGGAQNPAASVQNIVPAPAQAATAGSVPASQAMPPATPTPNFPPQQLDTALAPVALYPDSLLAQLLMATTYPDQVMEAAKWSKEHPKMKGEEAVKVVQDKNWDPSVASLVAFPEVLDMLSKKPDWVKELGEMFLADPDAVMDTIQALRRKAKEAGNLKSTKEQKVVVKELSGGDATASSSNGGNTIIEIQPANPQTVYVPVYNPTTVYGSWWYPTPPYYYHPPYYNPVAAVIGFGAAIAVGHALWSHWDWHHHDIDININRYNNINVNKRLDIKKQRLSWRQNIRERNPRYNQISRERINNRVGNRTRPAQNDRARELQRAKARQQLKQRGGVDLDRARQNLRRNPEQIKQAVDRANRMSPEQKRQLQNRASQHQRPTRNVKRLAKPAAKRTRPTVTQRPKSTRPVQKRPVETRPTTIERPASRPKPKLQRQPRSRPSAIRARPSRPSGAGRGRATRAR